MLPLRYGDPPAVEDCVDIGTVESPKVISNDPNSEYKGDISKYDTYGARIPEWSRVRYALRKIRNKELPVTFRIDGIGRIIVGEEGWSKLDD